MDNAAAVFIDAPVEEGHGDRTALATPSGSVTYAQLQRLTDRAGRALRALGVEPEQRVAMLLPDGPAWAATFFAALKLGDWFRTGDVYRRDADGGHVHRGREDDFFKVAGQWVAPAEVESVLLRHPGVLDSGVVGAPEAGGLIKPFVFVVPRDPTTEPETLRTDLQRFLEGALPPHQRPREIRIVSELPRTATGKLERFRLRDLAQARA